MATYDVLSIYPEGRACDACGNKIKNNFFITISGRTVCSYNCKKNLKSKLEDSCYICGKPVWEGNCYATRTKYICSDKCKDLFLKEREQNFTNGSRRNNSQYSNDDDNLISLKIKYGNPFLFEFLGGDNFPETAKDKSFETKNNKANYFQIFDVIL